MKYLLVFALLLLAVSSQAFVVSTTWSDITVTATVVGDPNTPSYRIGNLYCIYAVATVKVIYAGETSERVYRITRKTRETGTTNQITQSIRSGLTAILKNSLQQYIMDAMEASSKKQILDLSNL